MADTSALRRLALSQGGVFSPADAAACGWSLRSQRVAVASGQWQRLHPGVLVDRVWLQCLDPQARHVVLLHARLRFRAEGWFAARRSATLVHGLPLIGRVPARPQLVRDKSSPGLRGHSRHERVSPLPSDERAWAAVPVTSVARTVIDVARCESFRSAVVVADAALRRGLPQSEAERLLARTTGWPGARAAREVIEFADGRAETPLESLSRVAFHRLHVPAPELQVEVWCDGLFQARVDFLWREQNLIGEADGKAKYATVEELYKEKRREERLRDLGFEVVRWDWDAAYNAGPALRAAVDRGRARGSLNSLAPGVVLRGVSRDRRAA